MNTDARESRCRKIGLCNLGGWKKKKGSSSEVEGRERGKGAERLSNYPFKPNLRCCLKLTYANEVAKSHWGPRWLRLYRSKIGFHTLSQYHQTQIRNCWKSARGNLQGRAIFFHMKSWYCFVGFYFFSSAESREKKVFTLTQRPSLQSASGLSKSLWKHSSATWRTLPSVDMKEPF